ncbi:MAG: adenine-specific DNA-methyltransferase [Candidatus Sumerlaeota bacterium]|nr:adenine-specific DNA-methyltransferase [Candidatus Sumerlaeota bacterium]
MSRRPSTPPGCPLRAVVEEILPAGEYPGLARVLAPHRAAALALLESTRLKQADSAALAALLDKHFPARPGAVRRSFHEPPCAAPDETVAFHWANEHQILVPGASRGSGLGDLFLCPNLRTHLTALAPEGTAAQQLFRVFADAEEGLLGLFHQLRRVTESRWYVSLDRVPSALLPRVVAAESQQEAWLRDHGVDAASMTPSALAVAHPGLPVDTGVLDEQLASELLSSLAPLDQCLDGLLLHADNLDALRLLAPHFEGRVRTVYIDPPFNTEDGRFLYRDAYERAVWLTFMANRIDAALSLLASDGSFFAHIDYNEKEHLKLLLEARLAYITEIIWRIGWISGFKSRARKFIRNHETIYHFAKAPRPFFRKVYLPYPPGYVRRGSGKPAGKGIPLDDTWNCSEADPLASIQIMSFSREKAGSQQLTQKNENLLERMIEATSEPGDWVLDFFLGSGTTAATAQKMGRRWIGIEVGEAFDSFTLPRLKRVLYGDPYGISEKRGHPRGGIFRVVRLESFVEALENAGAPPPPAFDPFAP